MFFKMVGDLHLSQVRIVQRELNDRISHFLISSILVNMIGAYLLFKSLNTAFSDQFSVPVNGVSGDTTDTGSFMSSFSASSRTSSFF